jgi:hypothetical protein
VRLFVRSSKVNNIRRINQREFEEDMSSNSKYIGVGIKSSGHVPRSHIVGVGRYLCLKLRAFQIRYRLS